MFVRARTVCDDEVCADWRSCIALRTGLSSTDGSGRFFPAREDVSESYSVADAPEFVRVREDDPPAVLNPAAEMFESRSIDEVVN